MPNTLCNIRLVQNSLYYNPMSKLTVRYYIPLTLQHSCPAFTDIQLPYSDHPQMHDGWKWLLQEGRFCMHGSVRLGVTC